MNTNDRHLASAFGFAPVVGKPQSSTYEELEACRESEALRVRVAELERELKTWKPEKPDRSVQEDGSIFLAYHYASATVRQHREGDMGMPGDWVVQFGNDPQGVYPDLSALYGHLHVWAAEEAQSFEAGDFCETCRATEFPCACEIEAEASQGKLIEATL